MEKNKCEFFYKMRNSLSQDSCILSKIYKRQNFVSRRSIQIILALTQSLISFNFQIHAEKRESRGIRVSQRKFGN